MTKIVKNHENYTGIFKIFDSRQTFDRLSKMYQNIRHFIFVKGGIISLNYTEVLNCYRNTWP